MERGPTNKPIMINGKIAGGVLRVPKTNSIKANFHAGGKPVKTNITLKEKHICKKIADEFSG